MKLPHPTKNTKRLKAAVVKYRLKIKDLRLKMVQALRDYKLAVDKERIEVASKVKKRPF